MKGYSEQKNWRKVLKKNLKYDRPFMANAGCLIPDSKSDNIVKIDQLGATTSSDDQEEEDESSSHNDTVTEHDSEEEKDKSPAEVNDKSPSYEPSSPSVSGGTTSSPGLDPKKRSTIYLAKNSLLNTS